MKFRSNSPPKVFRVGQYHGFGQRRVHPRGRVRHRLPIRFPDFCDQLGKRIACHELLVFALSHDHDDIVEMPDSATKLSKCLRFMTGAHQAHDFLAQRALDAQYQDFERFEFVLPYQVRFIGVYQEIVNECGDRHHRLRLGIRERVDFDQKRVRDLAELRSIGPCWKRVRRFSESAVLGFPWMLWLIFQFLRDCTLNCFDQLSVLRAAEVVVLPQCQVDVLRKTLNESMRL